MTAIRPTPTTPLRTHERLLLQLDRLMMAGQSESDDAESVRDVMEVSWSEMTSSEREIAKQLSADLYTLHPHAETHHPPGTDILSPALARDLAVARDRNDYLCALRLVQDRAREVSAERAAVMRGTMYEKLGLIDAAMLFFDHFVAAANDRDSASIYFLTKLRYHGRLAEAANRIEAILHSRSDVPIELLIIAADVNFDLAQAPSGELQEDRLIVAEQLYRRALEKIGSADNLHLRWGSASFCHSKISASLMLRQQYRPAVEELDAAIANDEGNEGLLVQRGLLTRERDSRAAVQDFQRAVELGTSSFHAYLYLALDAWKSEDFERCLKMADAARRRTSDMEVQAHLHELSAMAIASREEPLSQDRVSRIRKHFRAAATLSPTSPSIQENTRLFESALAQSLRVHTWHAGLIHCPDASPEAIVLEGVYSAFSVAQPLF